ncbi:FecR family protein [Novosphingobium resinovorum]|uniref:Uncharacterized protein n=1 Tax=Novosphingobium resinovorum TaxID=158500 RepID=A0A1D8A2V8_9SPHN|nr:FecR domain-containing protein [Novosphingobium resinovorum]AOR76400.1 hypothetical protein BES08_06270 [Novosphingobium resinovorum]
MTDPSMGRYPARIIDEAVEWQLRLETPTQEIELEFARWLAADPRHEAAFGAVCENWADSEIVVERPTGRDRKLARAPFYLRRSTYVAAGTCLAILVAAGLVVAVAAINQSEVISSARAATFETRIGEIRTFALADGTEVTLDTDSMLRTVAGSPRRVELLRGRARFAPAHSQHAFTVMTGRGNVRSNTGPFDVSLIAGRPRVSTIEGHTELEIAGSAGGPVILARNEQRELGPGGRVEKVAAGQLLWAEGMLVFDATPLGEAVTAMNRYNRTHIEAPSSAAAHRVTGAFSARQPDAFAMAVAALFSLDVTRTDDGTLVLRRR